MAVLKILIYLCWTSLITCALNKELKVNPGNLHVFKPNVIDWENCGDPESPIQVESFSLSPAPIIPRKMIKISAVINVKKEIGFHGQNVTGDACLKIRIGTIYKDMCDLLKFHCHVDDFCKTMTKYSLLCPHTFKKEGFNCTCPIKPGRYEIKDYSIRFPGFEVSVHGSFETAVAIKDDYSMLGCLNIKFCINRCS